MDIACFIAIIYWAKIINDRDPIFTWLIPSNIKKMSGRRDLKGLIKALRFTDNTKIRHDAAEALQMVGLPAVEPLISVIKNDQSSPVCDAAIEALGNIGDVRAVEPLIAILKQSNYSRIPGDVAAEALGNIGDKRAIDPLISALEHNIVNIRKASAKALARIGGERAESALRIVTGEKSSSGFNAHCDICNKKMDYSMGYALTTRQVAMNEKYWKRVIEDHPTMDENLLTHIVQQQAMQRSGWLVCWTCSDLFIIDMRPAREYANLKTDPPGSGAVDIQEVARVAAKAWKGIYGKFPSWVL
jgi:HEAT repeat protein